MATGEKVATLTGSVPDVVSMFLGISDAMAPDKGFAYNLCTFQIDLSDEKDDQQSKQQASSAARSADASNSCSAATVGSGGQAASSGRLQNRPGPTILVVKSGSVGESEGIRTVLEVGIHELATPDSVTGVVELRKLEDFTSFVNTLAIEVAVAELTPIRQAALLVIKGLVNPGGVGYAHFVGGVLIRARQAGAGTPSLVCEPQFITQAPPRARGAGLFGSVIETRASGDYLEVWMYRAPMFG
jgi:hypothetical protein